jgi:hypothetical protein
MKRWQRRKKIRRIRVQQKSKKVTFHEQILNLAEDFVESDENFLHDYVAKKTKAGVLAIVFGILSFFFWVMMFFDRTNLWIMLVFFMMFFTTLIFVVQYLVFWDRIPFWKDKLQKDSEFLQSAKSFR